MVISGNSRDALNDHKIDYKSDYKIQNGFRHRVMVRYLLETRVLVLSLTGFPNLELYFSVLHFQFLILGSTKQVVIQQLLG